MNKIFSTDFILRFSTTTKTILRTYPLSLLLTAAIWVVCLIDMPETPLDDVALIDKWVHFVMFGSLTLCTAVEYVRAKREAYRWSTLLLGCWMLSALMGGAVELAQAYLTTTRSGDWFDFLADGIGATLGLVICIPLVRFLARR